MRGIGLEDRRRGAGFPPTVDQEPGELPPRRTGLTGGDRPPAPASAEKAATGSQDR